MLSNFNQMSKRKHAHKSAGRIHWRSQVTCGFQTADFHKTITRWTFELISYAKFYRLEPKVYKICAKFHLCPPLIRFLQNKCSEVVYADLLYRISAKLDVIITDVNSFTVLSEVQLLLRRFSRKLLSHSKFFCVYLLHRSLPKLEEEGRKSGQNFVYFFK